MKSRNPIFFIIVILVSGCFSLNNMGCAPDVKPRDTEIDKPSMRRMPQRFSCRAESVFHHLSYESDNGYYSDVTYKCDNGDRIKKTIPGSLSTKDIDPICGGGFTDRYGISWQYKNGGSWTEYPFMQKTCCYSAFIEENNISNPAMLPPRDFICVDSPNYDNLFVSLRERKAKRKKDPKVKADEESKKKGE